MKPVDDTISFSSSDDEDTPVPAAGDTFESKYDLQKILASGGMGVVLLANHKHLDQQVAVKLLHGGASETTRKRFLREARLAAKLNVPNVGRVLDYGFSGDGTPYLVMELLVGRTLAKRMEQGPLPLDEALRLSRELLTGLAAIHASGVVHRDLKPSNLFLGADQDGIEHVKIIDFGIAKRMKDDLEAAGDPTLTSGGEVVGTLRYMSPEQLRHSASVDARADIWSAGVVMYQMFSGKPPLTAESGPQMAAKVLGAEAILEASVHNHLVTPEINRVLQRCLQRNPTDRYARAEDVLADLPLPSAPAPAQAALPPVEPPREAKSRLGPALLVGLTVLGLGTGALVYAGASAPDDLASLNSGLVPPGAVPSPGTVVPGAVPVATMISTSSPPAEPPPVRPKAKPTLRKSRRPQPKKTVDPRFDDRH